MKIHFHMKGFALRYGLLIYLFANLSFIIYLFFVFNFFCLVNISLQSEPIDHRFKNTSKYFILSEPCLESRGL